MRSIDSWMNSSGGRDTAFAHVIGAADLQQRTPAAVSPEADPRTSSSYVFLSTQRIIDSLQGAGFVPVAAAQPMSRRTSPLFAPHVIRFRRRYETVTLRDCVPEISCLNSHNGRTALQFRLALYRPICTNGLIVCDETLPVWKVPHRGNYFDEVIAAVVRQAEQFTAVGQWVERMEATMLDESQQVSFASQALALRFPTDRHIAVQPQQLLVARRPEDEGNDLWRVYNKVQESLIKGDLDRRSASGRLMRTRPVRAIARDVAINTGLWRLAVSMAA